MASFIYKFSLTCGLYHHCRVSGRVCHGYDGSGGWLVWGSLRPGLCTFSQCSNGKFSIYMHMLCVCTTCISDYHITRCSCLYTSLSYHQSSLQWPLDRCRFIYRCHTFLTVSFLPFLQRSEKHLSVCTCLRDRVRIKCIPSQCTLLSFDFYAYSVWSNPFSRSLDTYSKYQSRWTSIMCSGVLIMYPATSFTAFLRSVWRSLCSSSPSKSYYLTQQEQTGGHSVSGAFKIDVNSDKGYNLRSFQVVMHVCLCVCECVCKEDFLF